MKIVVLGGLGLQGKAALVDLMRSPEVSEVVCVDSHTRGLDTMSGFEGFEKLRPVAIDVASPESLPRLFGQGADAVIDLLPVCFMQDAFVAAIENGVPLVSTNYAHHLAHLDEAAKERGVSLMPECGLDPGIDLVIIGEAVRRFDSLTRLDSYCGGIPEPSACNNPLNYKISWNFEMVLTSQMRASRFIHNGRLLEVPAEAQHETEMNHHIDFPGLGRLEAIPNGDAVTYVERLGLRGTVQHAGRYSLRWPGWRDFWRTAKRLGLLEETPVPGLPVDISPKQFMVKHLEPRLAYGPNEKDIAPMVNIFEGEKEGRPKRLITRLLIRRDLHSGLMAMSLGVGWTAGIVAQMMAHGEITTPGLLSPLHDIPYRRFVEELAVRGIRIDEETDLQRED